MKKLGEILIEAQIITVEQLEGALKQQKRDGDRIGSLLVSSGVISEEMLLRAIAKQLHLPILDIASLDISENILRIFPKELMFKYVMIPVALKGLPERENLIVAVADPTDTGGMEWLQEQSPYPLRLGIAAEKVILTALKRFENEMVDQKSWRPLLRQESRRRTKGNGHGLKELGTRKADGLEEDTHSSMILMAGEEDTQLTGLTSEKIGIFDSSNEDSQILYALSEPTNPGIALASAKTAKIQRVAQSVASFAQMEGPQGIVPEAKAGSPVANLSAQKKGKSELTRISVLLEKASRKTLLKALVHLMVERKLISVDDLLEYLDDKE